MCRDCSVAEARKEKSEICITVSVIETSKDPSSLLDTLRDVVIPFLLETVIKGLDLFSTL